MRASSLPIDKFWRRKSTYWGNDFVFVKYFTTKINELINNRVTLRRSPINFSWAVSACWQTPLFFNFFSSFDSFAVSILECPGTWTNHIFYWTVLSLHLAILFFWVSSPKLFKGKNGKQIFRRIIYLCCF